VGRLSEEEGLPILLAAWAEYEAGYTAKRDCEMLTGIYRPAIGAGWKVSSTTPTARC